MEDWHVINKIHFFSHPHYPKCGSCNIKVTSARKTVQALSSNPSVLSGITDFDVCEDLAVSYCQTAKYTWALSQPIEPLRETFLNSSDLHTQLQGITHNSLHYNVKNRDEREVSQ